MQNSVLQVDHFFLICNKWSNFSATKIIDILSSQTSVSAEYPSHQTAIQAHHCKTLAEWVAQHLAVFCRVWLNTKALQSSKCRAKRVSLYYPCSFSVSQQPPIWELPSHYSMLTLLCQVVCRNKHQLWALWLHVQINIMQSIWFI